MVDGIQMRFINISESKIVYGLGYDSRHHEPIYGVRHCFIISVKVTAYDTVWIVSDNFAAKTFRPGFKKGCPEAQTYLKTRFEVKNYISSRFENNDTNILSRIYNSFVSALNKHAKLPRLVVIVLDDDLIEALVYTNVGVSPLLGMWFEWLATQLDAAI